MNGIAVVIVILVGIVIGLIIYNMILNKKIREASNTEQRIRNLSVVQDFMSAIGETSTVDNKIKKINDILIEKYEIKYSTIVVFNGAEYEVKASNVDSKHWETLRNLQNVDMFKDSIETATPKSVTVNSDSERLPYQQMEFGRAKSAVFFPLYIDNVYIGYWIIESGVPHDFDNVDITVLEVIKTNIVSVLKTVVHQKTLESIVREDQFSGLKTAEYLYGDGKKIIEQYTVSTICMFKITNLIQINKVCCRELGDKIITEVSKYIKEHLSDEYVFVRYMGPKFVIAFSGVDTNGVASFLNEIKEVLETTKVYLKEEEIERLNANVRTRDKVTKTKETVAIPRLYFVISSFYKGTAIEEVLKKQEQYLDTANITENDITNI